ncbi:hypothetical protein [Paraburkholderia phenazinium]|uniref:Uncharacterized protein n=1 Tax=Paraburkholderia phenazinium TaxID=60549 RepID=A0A1N6HSP5_9BURK|nr:hypothetical protein [Paraburkholderia phenazinium]SIO22750.1 hypothetical protein SAMN05444168_3573 [Paraburkholderia phenazinium]
MNQVARADVAALGELLQLVALGKTNDLLAKRFEREAKANIAKGAFELPMWFMVLCVATAAQGKVEDSARAAENAVNLAPKDLAIVGNVVATLGNTGNAIAALPFAWQLAEFDDRAGARPRLNALIVMRKALRFEEAAEMAKAKSFNENPFAVENARLLDARITRDITVEMRQTMLETAIRAVRGLGYTIRQTNLEQYDDQLRYEMFIEESPAGCGAVNLAIADALCERFDDPAPEAITFACRPLSSYKFDGEFITVRR